MTKKFLALTMVLVLAAGFAAVAAEHEDDRALMGTWENELTLDPNASDTFAAYDSVLDVDYTTGGLSYTSTSAFDLTGMYKQEFGVSSSVGLLDLSSTLNVDPSGGNLRFWESSADMTLGGVSIGTTFYLQKHDWDYSGSSYTADFWPEYSSTRYPDYYISTSAPDYGYDAPSDPQTASYGINDNTAYDSYVLPYNSPEYDGDSVGSFHDYGSGLELTFSGETPGGVSIDVTNTFGMMPETDAESYLTDELEDKVNTFIGSSTSIGTDPSTSDWSDVTANQVINELVYNGSTGSGKTVAKAWLAKKIGVSYGDITGKSWYDSTVWSSSSPTSGSAVSGDDYATLDEKADDFEIYVLKEASESSNWSSATDPYDAVLSSADSTTSSEVRSAFVNALKASVSIYGVADDTGKVVNTEFDIGGAGYDWDVTKADDTSGSYSDATVSFGLANVDVGPGEYGSSSLQYYSTLLEVENLSLGCCDFSNETKFTEHDGFAYTEFDFSMEMETFPVDVSATLKWDNTADKASDRGKTVTLTPSLSTDWSCFTVYTDLGSADGDIDSLTIEGFEISAELGHVEVTSLTALDTNLGVKSLDSSYHAYDEVLTIDKLESAGDLDFVVDIYTDFAAQSSNGLMPVALEGSASYPISSQFDLGSSLAVTDSGLQEVGLTLDYSF